MDIMIGMAGEIPVFSLSGRLDASTAPLLEERLNPLLGESAFASRVVFECAGLTYVSSAGLRVFLLTQRRLSARGGAVAFAGLNNQVLELFGLAGLQSLFPFEETVAAAAGRLA